MRIAPNVPMICALFVAQATGDADDSKRESQMSDMVKALIEVEAATQGRRWRVQVRVVGRQGAEAGLCAEGVQPRGEGGRGMLRESGGGRGRGGQREQEAMCDRLHDSYL